MTKEQQHQQQQQQQQQQVLLVVGDGTEEMEFSTPYDVLMRAGAHVTTASVSPQREVRLSRGLHCVADTLLDEAAVTRPWDAVLVPGGMGGARACAASELLGRVLRAQAARRGAHWIGAICAAPALVLLGHGLLNEHVRATGYPAEGLPKLPGPHVAHDVLVVVDEAARLVTARGPGDALVWSLTLARLVCGASQAEEVAKAMLVPMPQAHHNH